MGRHSGDLRPDLGGGLRTKSGVSWSVGRPFEADPLPDLWGLPPVTGCEYECYWLHGLQRRWASHVFSHNKLVLPYIKGLVLKPATPSLCRRHDILVSGAG